MGIFDSLFGGGSKQQTQSTTVDPYSKSKPLINKALADALKAYKGGYGANTYTGSTVVPYSTQTMAGMNKLQELAIRNDGSNNNYQKQLQNVMSNGGFNSQQQSALSGLQGLSKDVSGYTNTLEKNGGLNRVQMQGLNTMRDATGTVTSLLDRLGKTGGLSGAQSQALKNFQNVANSKYSVSPEFQNVLSSSLQDAREGVNANASAAGRYGSGIAQGVMTRELGDISSKARLNDMQNWQSRQDNANLNAANLGQAGIGNLSSLSQLQSGLGNATAQLGQQGVNNLQSMYGLGNNVNSSLFNAGQAGVGNMADAYQAAQMPMQTMMNLGGMYEDLAGRVKNDELRIFDSKNASPWDQIGRLMQVANLGGAYNTQNTTSQAPGQNPFLSALGVGLGGLSFLG